MEKEVYTCKKGKFMGKNHKKKKKRIQSMNSYFVVNTNTR